MTEEMKILKEVANKSDTFRDKAKALGKKAKNAFPQQQKSQMRNLENIANSTLKTSDVLDFIKRQTGRSKKDEGWKKEQFGNKLLEKIENELANNRNHICTTLNITDELTKLEIYLLLIREFIKQIVVHYEFELGENS